MNLPDARTETEILSLFVGCAPVRWTELLAADGEAVAHTSLLWQF